MVKEASCSESEDEEEDGGEEEEEEEEGDDDDDDDEEDGRRDAASADNSTNRSVSGTMEHQRKEKDKSKRKSRPTSGGDSSNNGYDHEDDSTSQASGPVASQQYGVISAIRNHGAHEGFTKQCIETESNELPGGTQRERYARVRHPETFFMSLEAKLDADLEKLDYQASMIKNRIPKEILQMTMGELRKTGGKLFVDVLNMGAAAEDMLTCAASNTSQLSIGSGDLQASMQKSFRTDEGYLTEDNAKPGLDVFGSAKPSKRPIGPLASAMKSTYARRRSNSVSDRTTTPCKQPQSSMLFGVKGKKGELRTPAVSRNLLMGNSERFSRPKLRTPLVEPGKKGRPQTVSTDRGISQITLKVHPNTPLAFIRHPRVGENVYSLTGSPVVNSVMTKHMANVNIPVPNGMLSLQPTDLQDVDAESLPTIDLATLEHLKKLQANLNIVMQHAEKCNFFMDQ
uniref:Borealin C-terminal domain-containing protein n=1 Tax=Anopheles dirus TaxID=7168 RepID=A0A182MXH1_9DIPT